MADSSDVDAAVVNRLLTDVTLTNLLPDGVYFDYGGHGKTRFVLVSQLAHEDEDMFGGPAYERFTYLLKGVELSTTGANIKAAAARIHTLFSGTTFTVTGYGLMTSKRVERVRYTEVDETNADIRWQHRGGHYEIWVSP
jgi:hypothetical protein